MRLVIKRTVIPYAAEELARWEDGERSDCPDKACREKSKGKGRMGFAEFMVGKHLARLGCEWMHQKFDLVGWNVPGKYPEAEVVLRSYGVELERQGRLPHGVTADLWFERIRLLNSMLGPIIQPDVLAWKPDFSELRLAEAKLVAGKYQDYLDRGQKEPKEIWGLDILSRYFRCPTEVCWVVPEDRVEDFAGVVYYSLTKEGE